MKKFLPLILIFAFFIILGSIFWYDKISELVNDKPESTIEQESIQSSTSSRTTQTSTDYTFVKHPDKGIYVAVFSGKKIEYAYQQKRELNFKDFIESKGLEVAINSGYFLNDGTHAGLLILDSNQLVSELAPADSQLTHVIELTGTTFNIEEAQSYIVQDKKVTAFQAGPLVIEQGKVASKFIDASINGSGEYLRTLMGKTNSGKVFFVVVNERITLMDLADEILGMEVFKGEIIDLINLDGGSSIAMYAKDNLEFNLGTYKKLPYVIGVR